MSGDEMGRAEKSFEDSLMTAGEIAAHLIGCCGSLARFDVYMFGSTLEGIGEDIDILVVGPGGVALAQIKQEMRLAAENLPLHILYMQPSEVHHTEFIARENCVPLAQLASSAAFWKGARLRRKSRKMRDMSDWVQVDTGG
jgi:hypothetical protein